MDAEIPASAPGRRTPRSGLPTVFLSAATLDLKAWRDHLDDAFRRAGFRVLTQDHSLRSAPGDVRRLLAETVDEADCIIHLAGTAYGSDATDPFPSQPGFRCSWTQFEYYLAHERKKDVIAFVCAPDLSASFVEKADAPGDLARKQQSQEAHRERVEKGTFTGTPLEQQFTAADGTPLRTCNESVADPGRLLSAVAAAVGTLHTLDREHRESAARELQNMVATLGRIEKGQRGTHRLLIAALLGILLVALGVWLVMKAALHEGRFETAERERAIRDAIADAPDWWRPHNALGVILYRRAEWKAAEQEYEAARKSMGTDGEATVLNNLAQLYQATNRLAEAEPLERRAVVILLKSTRAAGHIVPNLKDDIDNYRIILGKLSLPAAEITQRLAAAGREAGYTDEEFRALLALMFGPFDVAVKQVLPEGQGPGLGIRVGDVVRRYAGQEITNAAELIKLTGESKGEAVPLEIQRGTETLKLTAKPGKLGLALEDRPKPAAKRGAGTGVIECGAVPSSIPEGWQKLAGGVSHRNRPPDEPAPEWRWNGRGG